jgi:hypothetical protein
MFLTSVILLIALEAPVKEDKYRCIKWTWYGDVYNRVVICLEWKKVNKK